MSFSISAQWKPQEVARLLALLEAERRQYEEMLATLPAALVVLASDHSIVSANRAFCRLLNLRNSDLRQKMIEEVLPSDRLIERIKSARLHGDNELVIRTHQRRVFRVTIVPLRNWEDDMEAETLLMVEDRNEGEESLHDAGPPPSEPVPLPAAALVDLSTFPVILWQASLSTFAFLSVNGAAEEILGYPAQHWLTTPQFISGRIHPADRRDVMALYRSLAATGGEASAEYRAVRASGETLWCRETIRATPPAAGQGGGMVAGVLSKIDQRRQLEVQSRIAGRMEAVRDLASCVGQNLKKPLMIVRGYGEEMLNPLAARNPQPGDIAEILRATTSMTELAGRLRSFTGQPPKVTAKVSLNRLIRGLRERLQAMAGETVALGLDLGVAVATFADHEQLEEVLLALASSALENTRFTTRLNVVCQVDSIRERLDPATLKPGTYARIEIHADGVGLSTPVEGMFESVLPVEDRAKSAGPDISRAYIYLRNWGGDVFFSSHVARGSLFVVYLPDAEPDESAALEAAPTPEPETHRKTIHLAYDAGESGISDLIRKILLRESKQAFGMGGGERALGSMPSLGESLGPRSTEMSPPSTQEQKRTDAVVACAFCQEPAQIVCSGCQKPLCHAHTIGLRFGPPGDDVLEMDVCPECSPQG